MEINKSKVTNTELLAAIEEMQKDNSKDNVNNMINAVMKATFLTPAKISPPENVANNNDGKTVMQRQSQVQFQLIQNGDNEQYFPAFTDEAELKKWTACKENQQCMNLTFDDYAAMLMDPKSNVAGFVLNPFGKSVAFPKAMTLDLKQQKDAMKGGLVRQDFNKDEKLEFSEPKEYPIDMMAAVIGVLQDMDNVNAAYLRLFKKESDEKHSYLIVVDFQGDPNQVFSVIAKAANPHLNGMALNMMPYNIEFVQKAVNGVEPFYQKEN